jgi:hypothetical protein
MRGVQDSVVNFGWGCSRYDSPFHPAIIMPLKAPKKYLLRMSFH